MAAPVVAVAATAIPTNVAAPTISITTTQTDYILILSAYNEGNGAAAATVTSVTSAGMTWALRRRSNGSTTGGLELWWAHGTGTLSAYVITVHFSGSYDDGSICLAVVTGCANSAAPFDGNASLPAALSAPTGTWTPSFTGISTTSTDDLLLFISGAIGGGDTPATGFTQIARAGNAGGTRAALSRINGMAVTSLQTNATFTHGSALTTLSSLICGEAIFDALAGNLPAGLSTQARAMVLA